MAEIKPERRGGARKNAGRKPLAVTKSAYFSTRLDEATRDRLEREAASADPPRSLSAEIQMRLKDSLNEKHDEFAPHVRALGHLVMHLATGIELSTGRPWNEDQFAHQALKRALEVSLAWSNPGGDAATPNRLQQMPAGMTTPEGIGDAVAFGLRQQMMMDAPTGKPAKNVHTARGLHALPALGAKLFPKEGKQK